MTDPVFLHGMVAVLALTNLAAVAAVALALGHVRRVRNLLAASDPMLALLDDVPPQGAPARIAFDPPRLSGGPRRNKAMR